MYCPCFASGPGFNPQRRHFFFPFSCYSLIPFQSTSLYIIASFEVYLIAENNYPPVLVVLFSTAQYILTPSIFDMPLLHSISSLKSMTDMRGSSNFRLRGGGGAGQNLTEKGFASNLSTVDSTSSTCLQWDQLSISKKTVLFGSKGGPTFSRGGGLNSLLIPFRTCDFQGESGPPVTPPPPTSSLGPCMCDPSQNDRALCLNHKLRLVCIALIFLLQKITYSIANMHAYL